jgi:hypothetical protein
MIKPNEQSAIGPTQMQSTWRTLSKHVQLMTQNQKFSVKSPSRLEAVAQHADEEGGNCDHQSGLCSDSGDNQKKFYEQSKWLLADEFVGLIKGQRSDLCVPKTQTRT